MKFINLTTLRTKYIRHDKLAQGKLMLNTEMGSFISLPSLQNSCIHGFFSARTFRVIPPLSAVALFCCTHAFKNKSIFSLLIYICFAVNVIAQPCAGMPEFVDDLGYENKKIALSTSEGIKMGLVLVELGDGAPKKAERKSSYQHPSWDDEGYLIAITRDPKGNIYVAPKPNVNMYYTKEENINSIFRIDSKTGIMKYFMSLPKEFDKCLENPFGIMDIRYDCTLGKLLVTSIYGSDRNNQRGIVYVVDIKTKTFTKIIEGQDVMGICLIPDKGSLQLIYCNMRNGVVKSVMMDRSMNVKSPESFLFSLEGVGPRGDDVARKIVYFKEELTVYGTPFSYNLTAPTFAPETIYTYGLNVEKNQWVLKGMR